MGPFTNLFDLLFAMAFLASVGCLLAAAILAVRGHGLRALNLLRLWAMGAAVYMTALISVSFAQPQQVLAPGELRCWDDWCLIVNRVQHSTEPQGVRYDVGLDVLSRARRVDQRGLGTTVYLVDDRGRRYDPLSDPAEVPLSVLLRPSQSVALSRTFAVPEDAHQLGLIVDHGGGPSSFISGGPGSFIIGDEHSLFHKRTIVKLP